VKKRSELLTLIATVATFVAVLAWGCLMQGQTASPSTQQPSTPSTQTQQPPMPQTPAQQPTQPPSQTPPSQTPDASQTAPTPGQPTASDSTGSKEFVGTVVKQGDKYVLQEASTGTTYDIDHQDEVSKFEGKKVRVHGTLDPASKTIHVQ
jgi:cytoskeletal protein RodZ